MSSFPKTKLAVKSDPWFIDANIIRTVGFQESPIFGTELTKFYMRAERDEIFFHLRLYLAACKEEKVQVVVNLFSGFNNPPTSEDCQNGGKCFFVVYTNYYPITQSPKCCNFFTFCFLVEISLDKTKKILIGLWSVSLFVSSEVIFEESDSVLQQKHYEALSSQLLNLRENSNSSDIVLVTTVDRREFQAHKNILASRSAVFSAMFQHGNFIENKKNRVEIDDVTGEVMDALLRYIYSADVQGIEKIAEHLLPAADKVSHVIPKKNIKLIFCLLVFSTTFPF